jgi:thioredoxin reductase
VEVGHQTSVEKVFMVGDTVSAEAKLDSVVQSAISLAEAIVGQD